MFVQPSLGAFYQLKECFCPGIARKRGLALLLFHPAHGCFAVAVYAHVPVVLPDKSKSVHDGEKLSDVVGAEYRAEMKNLLPVSYIHPLIFHLPRISAAGSVHSKRIENHIAGIVGHLQVVLAPGGGRASDVLGRRRGIGLLRFGKGVEAFVNGSFHPFCLGFTVFPGFIDAGHLASPNHIIFLFISHFVCEVSHLFRNFVHMMIKVFLLGFMGAGKTTLGKAFARALNMDFIDLDWYIEGRFHRTVRQIFDERGEEGFRQIERNMLHEVAEFENVIVSLGGGTPCFFDNMEYMNGKGQTVYIEVEPHILARRLKLGKEKRPLLKDKTDDELLLYVNEAMEKRAAYYEQAQFRIDGGPLESKKQIEDSVLRLGHILGIDMAK